MEINHEPKKKRIKMVDKKTQKIEGTLKGFLTEKLADKKYLYFRKYTSMHSHDRKCTMP